MALWQDWVRRGTTVNKPAAATANEGMLYYDTDLKKLQRSSGAAWEDVEPTMYSDADAIAAVEGEATLDLTGSATIAAGQTLGVDTINEKTVNAGVSIDGLNIIDSSIALDFEPGSDNTATGIIITATVDSNSTGIGCPLFLAADGHFDEADADSSTTAPALALALETGTGSKKVLLFGILRHDAWAWTTGPGTLSLIYLSTDVGTLTQTQPSGADDVIQPVGWAISDDCIMFAPSLMYLTHT